MIDVTENNDSYKEEVHTAITNDIKEIKQIDLNIFGDCYYVLAML